MTSTHEDLRAAVLASARHLLVQRGWAGVSMRRIADDVGCSASSIYLYFAGKDALVHALIDEGFQRWYDAVLEKSGGDGPPLERLEAYCREYVRWGLENREMYEVMYMFHPERMARYPRELFRRATRSMDLLTALVSACAPRAFAGEDDARIAAHAVWTVLHGIVSTLVAGRLDRRVGEDRFVDGSIRFALTGIEALATP
jgi:AcrR family transcriptional regulator